MLNKTEYFFAKILTDKNTIWYIIGFNFLVRLIIASFTNLSNDEVYYTLYSEYLDWSYFDHPPLVGVLIWLTSFGNAFQGEIFIRFSSIIIGVANILLIYKTGKILKNWETGIIAALLLSVSFYASIVVGTFIMPDSPQSFFWLLSIYFFILYIKDKNPNQIIFFGIAVGFALLSKYHSIFLWLGAMIYFILKDRDIFRNPKLYFGVLISLILFSPVILWNYFSPFSGFAFQQSRVVGETLLPNFKNFFPEFFGEIFYQNPFNIFLILSAIIIIVKQKTYRTNDYILFFLLVSIPLILAILSVSLYKRTLPHWTGPAYFSLFLLVAMIYSDKKSLHSKTLKNCLLYGNIFFFSVISLGFIQIKTGFLNLTKNNSEERVGKDDFSLDMALWYNISEELKSEIPQNSIIITNGWFPAAHLDFYFARKNSDKIYVYADDSKLLHYVKINKLRGKIPTGSNVYYVSTSKYFEEPPENLKRKFHYVSKRKAIEAKGFHQLKLNIFIWELYGLNTDIL